RPRTVRLFLRSATRRPGAGPARDALDATRKTAATPAPPARARRRNDEFGDTAERHAVATLRADTAGEHPRGHPTTSRDDITPRHGGPPACDAPVREPPATTCQRRRASGDPAAKALRATPRGDARRRH